MKKGGEERRERHKLASLFASEIAKSGEEVDLVEGHSLRAQRSGPSRT